MPDPTTPRPVDADVAVSQPSSWPYDYEEGIAAAMQLRALAVPKIRPRLTESERHAVKALSDEILARALHGMLGLDADDKRDSRADENLSRSDGAESVQADNPCSAAESRRFARILRALLAALDREIVVAALVGNREADLLDSEREEVHRVRKFLNGRIAVRSELSDLRGRALAVLDSVADCFEAGSEHNASPSVDGGSSPTVGDGPVAGVSDDAPATDGHAGFSESPVATSELHLTHIDPVDFGIGIVTHDRQTRVALRIKDRIVLLPEDDAHAVAKQISATATTITGGWETTPNNTLHSIAHRKLTSSDEPTINAPSVASYIRAHSRGI